MNIEKLKDWINEYSDIISIKPIDKKSQQDEIDVQQTQQERENQNDVNFFIDVFDGSEMDNNVISIKKISNNLKNKQMIEGKILMEEIIGIRIKWYNLKCEGPAWIEYEDSIKCDHVWEALQKEKNFTRLNPTTIQFKYYKGGLNFDNEVDWMQHLVEKFHLIPQKISINREKKPDHFKQESFVKYIMKNNVTPNFSLLHLNSYAETSKKSAKVQILLEQDIRLAVQKLHQQPNIIGCTKCFISPFYYYIHQIDSTLRSYIKNSLDQDQQISISISQKICKVTFLTQENEIGLNIEVIRIKARDINLFQVFKQKLHAYIEGSQIVIFKEKYSIGKLLTAEGKIFLGELNQQYNCYIKYKGQVTTEGNFIIHVFGLTEDKLNELQHKIEEMLGTNSTLVLQLNEEDFKMVNKMLELEDMKQEFNLEQLFFNKAKRQLVVEGLEQNTVTFKEQFSQMLKNIQKMTDKERDQIQKGTNQNQLINMQSPQCEICLMDIDTAYRLQACRHKFCLPCVNLYLQDCLKNIQQFPLKCPKCSQEMVIQDLVRLLNDKQWSKLVSLSTNKYVSENGRTASFCFTPNCLYIFDPSLPKYRCPLCLVTFCTPCKKPSHPGLTCREAQLGIDILFKNYMADCDARYCPNNNCGAVLMKVDGCNKVECRNCHKAICWHKSCMIAFETADKCYEHLRNKHGGYYD